MMAPKKRNTQGGDDDQIWLMSYADMMTLVACFFILMMAFANYDPVGFTKISEEIRKHFNKDKYKSSMTKMDELSEEITLHPELKKKVKVSQIDNQLVIVFEGSALYERGKFALNDGGHELLDIMISIIKARDPNYKIIVEGYADDVSAVEYPELIRNNWSLSALRASDIAERFELFGFDPLQLSVVSHGDSSLREENKEKIEEMGDSYLRRVVVKVVESSQKGASVKLGPGVYFKDL